MLYLTLQFAKSPMGWSDMRFNLPPGIALQDPSMDFVKSDNATSARVVV